MFNPSDMDMDNSDAANTELEGYAEAWDDEDEEAQYMAIEDDGLTDVEADADTLASAGYGTDEDYGDYGQYEYESAGFDW